MEIDDFIGPLINFGECSSEDVEMKIQCKTDILQDDRTVTGTVKKGENGLTFLSLLFF